MMRFLQAVLLLLMVGSAHAQSDPVLAITNVNVVTMAQDGVLRDQTLLVEGRRVAALGSAASVKVPAGATRIDGRGKYVMPGLTDMHVHLAFQMLIDSQPEQTLSEHLAAFEKEMQLYVGNGVTTVRNMWGNSVHLLMRKKVEQKAVIGPRIFTAGAILDASPLFWPTSRKVETPEAARLAVLETVAQGYDFVKVYSRLGRREYDAILATAREEGIPVIGHVSMNVPLDHAFVSGQKSIEHMVGYHSAVTEGVKAPEGVGGYALWAYADEKAIPALARKTAASGVWNVPTLVVLQNFMAAEKIEAYLSRPELAAVPDKLMQMWREDPILPHFDETYRRLVRESHQRRLQMIKAMHDAGARLLIGTDASAALVVPGYSIHEELQYFVDAGLSPYAALRASTADAAEFLGVSKEQGTLEVGKRADVLLLSANPLAAVANVKRLEGLVLNGTWVSAPQLRQMLEKTPAGASSTTHIH